MKKFAWTLIELMIAIAVVIMLSAFLISGYKPGANKNKLFFYSAMSNLTKANIAVMERNSTGGLNGDLLEDGTTDWYCAQLADVISIASAPNCTQTQASTAATAVNMTFPNGITFQGLANKWTSVYDGASGEYKNIVIDIDGPEKGPNKPGVDRFPIRVFRGQVKTEGIVMPVNCKNDKVWNPSGNSGTGALVSFKTPSPYCKSGTAYSGSIVSRDFTIDDEIITYDIFKVQSSDENAKLKMIASGLSAFEADCGAYGGVEGFYSQSECATAGVKIHTNCVTTDNCAKCTTGNCPLNASGTQTNATSCKTYAETSNPNNYPCFTVMHKPSGGVPFFLQAIIGDIE